MHQQNNYKFISKPLAPTFKFGAIFVFIVIIFLILIVIKLSPDLRGYDYYFFNPSKVRVNIWMAISTALCIPTAGWFLSSYMNAKNMMKQHSLNILLQSRTSDTYTRMAHIANKLGPLEYSEMTSKQIRAVRYLLNFLEFVSIGIKHGDLDEATFKDAWKGLFSKVILNFGSVIKNDQLGNPKMWIHIEWINYRWQKNESSFKKIIFYILAPLFISTITIILCFFIVQLLFVFISILN